jgi:general stress protein 26
METQDFGAIEEEFIQRAHSAVWAAVATVDRLGRPRSRVLHPIWQGQVGWIATRPQSHKAKHLARNPYVSLAYMKDPLNPVYVDCKAAWERDPAKKARIWDLFLTTPPPLGYDPRLAFGSLDDPRFGVLKLTPWRIQLYTLDGENKIWRAPAAPASKPGAG